jgi:hypothetical protein
MDTAKSTRCIIGWHRWQVVAEESMRVRICTDCGRRRFHGPLPGEKSFPVTNGASNYTGGGGFGGDGG